MDLDATYNKYKNASSNIVSIVVSVNGVPVVIDQFSENGFWKTNEVETADMAVTPDGESIYWAKTTPIEATLTLKGTSIAGDVLVKTINAQRSILGFRGKVVPISVTIERLDRVEVYDNGVLRGGSPGDNYGGETIEDKVFNFKFGKKLV